MVVALVNQDKRESYTEDRTDSARNVRNNKRSSNCFNCEHCGKPHKPPCWKDDSDSAPQWLKDKLKWEEDQRNRVSGGENVKRVRSAFFLSRKRFGGRRFGWSFRTMVCTGLKGLAEGGVQGGFLLTASLNG